MGYIPLFIVIAGVLFLVIAVNYHTFKNYNAEIQRLISRIQEIKKQVRAEIDELETLSVTELQGFCESMCAYLSGRLDSGKLEEKMSKINQAFGQLYSENESKHIQDELLKSINIHVAQIASLHRELKENQVAYEKLLNEKPYSYIGRMLHFDVIRLPWENEPPSMMSA